MEEQKKKPAESESQPQKDKPESWLDKAEAKIDETAEKIHKSETYHKVDQKMEEVTKKLFRKAGRWWGKL